jgi:putative transposon-encoded protein
LPAAAWFLRTDAGATIGPLLFGQSGDVPVPGDYLGLGHAQIAVFRPRTGEWLIRTDAGRAVHIALGKSGDVPVPGDYAGTGRLQIAIYRPTTGEWFRRAASGAVTRVQWGAPGDLPVPAPYPREFGIRAVVDYFDPPD